jgi:hypothetical protein
VQAADLLVDVLAQRSRSGLRFAGAHLRHGTYQRKGQQTRPRERSSPAESGSEKRFGERIDVIPAVTVTSRSWDKR